MYHTWSRELMPTDKAMTMIYRWEWEPIPPRYRLKTQLPLDVVILRYTNSDPCTEFFECSGAVNELQKHHIEKKGFVDILWNFLIGGCGDVFEGTGWRHTTGKEKEYWDYEFKNLDIAYIAKGPDDVTPEMRWAARKLLEHSMSLELLKEDFKIMGEQSAIDALGT